MASQACVKYGTMEEVRQMEQTMSKREVIAVNGVNYLVKQNKNEVEWVVQSNKRTYFQNLHPSGEVDKYGHFQGNLGEYQIKAFIDIVLKWEPVLFDKCNQGFDDIYRDKDRNIMIVETKFTNDKDGLDSLNKDTNQMSIKWIDDVLLRMEKGNLSSETNVNVAKMINNAKAIGSFRRVLLHMHPASLNVVISERDYCEKWTHIDGYMNTGFEK